MRHIQYLLIIIILTILGSIIILHAQEDCDIADAEKVIQVVQNVCEQLGDNQVCYGNFEVGADWLDNLEEEDLPDITFETPGDVADVEKLKSLYLSALDPKEDTWGIAQMRLLAPSTSGAHKLNLLLFGDVSVENSADPTLTIPVQVDKFPANIRNVPTISAIVLQSVPVGTTLEAVGRLEDSSWIRVKTENNAIGWILASLVAPTSEGQSFEDLEVQDGASPYFGPMQAFVFEQGASSVCGNLNSDGLIIQTPQGPANVNVSINGVNIDLVPTGGNGASAFIKNSNAGMTVSMIAGNSYVSSGGTTYHMSPGEQTTIGSSGIPTMPSTYDVNDLNIPGLASISPIDTIDPAIDVVGGTSDTTLTGDATTTSTGSTTTTSGGSNSKACTAADPANPNACNKKK